AVTGETSVSAVAVVRAATAKDLPQSEHHSFFPTESPGTWLTRPQKVHAVTTGSRSATSVRRRTGAVSEGGWVKIQANTGAMLTLSDFLDSTVNTPSH